MRMVKLRNQSGLFKHMLCLSYLLIFTVEGLYSSKHFVEESSKAPPVNFLLVPSPFNYFWSEVVGGSSDRMNHFSVYSGD
jgi:hypothetical protein